MFDIPESDTVRHEWGVDIPIEGHDWQIGLIVGPSGSGKTTIARSLFGGMRFHSGYEWPEDDAIVDAFPCGIAGRDITMALSSVGFSSPPHWLKPFRHLSTGQKFRCELARIMAEGEDTVIDEFTSVVDRDSAKVSSSAFAKAIRVKPGFRVIAVSCHRDIVDWLDPDWTYDTADGSFHWGCLRGRPPIELRISPATTRDWPLFRGHHYLSRDINSAARCFIARWNGTPVAFTSYMHFPHPTAKNIKREHRTVVLPDYQGVGIGNRVSEWLGDRLLAEGFRFRSTTSHPSMIRHRSRSPLWRRDAFDYKSAHGATAETCGNRGRANALKRTSSAGRLTARFEYIGRSEGAQP